MALQQNCFTNLISSSSTSSLTHTNHNLHTQVLLNEEEIVSEDMRSKPAPQVQAGDRAFQKHICESRCLIC